VAEAIKGGVAGVAEEVEETVAEVEEGEAEVEDEVEAVTAVRNLRATRNMTAQHWFHYLKA